MDHGIVENRESEIENWQFSGFQLVVLFRTIFNSEAAFINISALSVE
jgi:hypothetical protein